MKKTIIGIISITGLTMAGVVLDPQYELVPWVHSQTVPVFDTPTGELGDGQWGETDNGQILYNIGGTLYSLDEGNHATTTVLALEEVRYVGTRAEDVFKDGTKEVVEAVEYEELKRGERLPLKTRLRFAGLAEGAITLHASSSAHSSFANSVTFALDCGSATDRGVVVFISNRNTAEITGVTYNGDALTMEADSLNSGVAGHVIYARPAADSGSNNVVVSNSNFRLHTAYATCLAGTDQTDIVEASEITGGFGGTISDSITSLTDGAWLMSGVNRQGAGAFTPDAGETELYDQDNSDGSLGQTAVSYFEKSTAGAETIGWTLSSSDNAQMATVAVKPSASAPTTPASCTFLQATNDISDLTEYTFASQNLGTTSADRYIIIGIISRKAGAATTITGVTIGGYQAQIVGQVTNNITNSNVSGIAVANVPTGSTGDIVVTFGAGMVRAAIQMYHAVNISGTSTFNIATSTADDPSATLNVPDNGCAIASALTAQATTLSWTGLTERWENTLETFVTLGSASNNFTTGSSSYFTRADFAASTESAGVFATWAPAEAPPDPGPSGVPEGAKLHGGMDVHGGIRIKI